MTTTRSSKITACLARNVLGITVLVVLGVASPAHATHYVTAAPSAVDTLSATYGCSNVGLAKGVIPAGALVTVGTTTTHTTFDAGWAAYMHTAPGVLAAVCVR